MLGDRLDARRAHELGLINESFEHGLTEQLLAEQDSFADVTAAADFVEGVNAFVGKRRPKFIGR